MDPPFPPGPFLREQPLRQRREWLFHSFVSPPAAGLSGACNLLSRRGTCRRVSLPPSHRKASSGRSWTSIISPSARQLPPPAPAEPPSLPARQHGWDRPAPVGLPSGRHPGHPAWPGCPSRRCGCPARRGGSPAHCRRQGCIPPPAIAPVTVAPEAALQAAPASPAAPAPAAARNLHIPCAHLQDVPPPGTAAAAGDR